MRITLEGPSVEGVEGVGAGRVVDRSGEEEARGAFAPGSWSGLAEMRSALRFQLLKFCADENEIDDVIQETYLRVARYRGRLARGTSLLPWAMRIAVNVLTDRRRRESRLPAASADDGEPPLVVEEEEGEAPPLRIGRYEVAHDEALGLLRRTLRTLQASDQRLLGSYYGDGGSCRRLAADSNLVPDQVKVRLFRARRRLGRAMRHRLALEFLSRPRGGIAAGAAS